MVRKRIAGVILAAVVAASSVLTGCAADIDPATTVATVGDTKISYGAANFLLRMQQATYDTYYKSYFGNDMWSKDVMGDGKTLTETVKDGVLDSLREMYVVDAHKADFNIEVTAEETEKINSTAKDFMGDNTTTVRSGYAVTRQEDVAEVLRLYTVRTKVANAIYATADKNVSDEEAAQRSFSFAAFSLASKTDESGNSVDLTDEEKDELRKKVAKLVEDCRAGGNFEELAKEMGQSVTTDNYGKDDTETVDVIKEAADKLKEGEFADVVEGDNILYVIRLDKEFDREATDKKKESIISDREQAKYTETVDKWKESVEITPVNDVWSKISFDHTMAMKQKSN